MFDDEFMQKNANKSRLNGIIPVFGLFSKGFFCNFLHNPLGEDWDETQIQHSAGQCCGSRNGTFRLWRRRRKLPVERRT